MKSAYLVAQGYANFCKVVLMAITSCVSGRGFRGLLVLDPESRDGSNCHPVKAMDDSGLKKNHS